VTSQEIVELDLPLSTRYASTARVVAASLAADAGFTVEEIDDLRIGLNEAVSLVADVDPAADPEARLRLRFDIDGHRITVRVGRSGTARGAIAVDVLAERILGAVVDEFSADGDEFVLAKSSASAATGTR
jgi:serine/threonine-protein kinase RsbW